VTLAKVDTLLRRCRLKALVVALLSPSLVFAGEDLGARYAKLELGDRIPAVEVLLGKPDAVKTTTVLGIDCTRMTYTDLLRGQTVNLYFSLGGRLISKSLEEKPLLPLPKFR